MAGGILQIVAYGAEDVYLTANPQITFFKIVYRRHTNFSQQIFQFDILDNPEFGSKNKVKLFRLGDLMTKMYLVVEVGQVVPKNGSRFAWVRKLGHAIIKSISIEMGGVKIDKQYGEWLDVWYELARTGKHERAYEKMVGDVPIMTTLNNQIKPRYFLYIPLQFWFNRHNGLALPLVAIQYHEIYINIEFNKRDHLYVSSVDFDQINDLVIESASIWADYIFLENEERYKFSYVQHEYLIEQVQYAEDEPIDKENKRVRLQFNHPVKELIWFGKNGNYTSSKEFLCYTNEDDWTSEILNCSLKFLRQSIVLLKGPVYLRDQYGNIVLDAYGNRIILEPGAPPPEEGVWENFDPETTGKTLNGQIQVINNSKTNTLWVNTNSLLVGIHSITGKISATITVSDTNVILITDFVSNITDHDISFPLDEIIDTRINKDGNVIVNQFNNYGLLISGRINPILFTQLDYNNVERFDKRNSKFFNYLQTHMHHNNTPPDGVNVYSFALQPEEHQPSGTSNMSRIEKIFMIFWFGDSDSEQTKEPMINIINLNSRLFIFAFNYNILRIVNGLTGLVYSG